MEYIQVDYPGRRIVLVDDQDVGYNRDEDGVLQTLEVPPGTCTIRLAGMHDFLPLALDLEIGDSSRDNPVMLGFAPIL